MQLEPKPTCRGLQASHKGFTKNSVSQVDERGNDRHRRQQFVQELQSKFGG